MPGPQWEVVGKKGKAKPTAGKQDKVSKEKAKKMNEIKVEEVLPVSQLKSLYGSNKGNKENLKPQPEKQKPQENGGTKKKKPEKLQEPKMKPSKSIDSALNSINPEEFNSIFEKNKNMFPDTPIVWLKELAQYLNKSLTVDIQDPVFSNKSENYPLSIMPVSIRSTIEKAISQAGATNAGLFFDICLTAMATDMNKDLPALGHKFFLQYLAGHQPAMVAGSLQKHNALKNSYQNRQSIGLSILWAVAQAGYKDFTIGMQIFKELMLPLIEMKNYSRFVHRYLLNLIKKDIAESQQHYLFIVDTVHSTRKNTPIDLNKDLLEQVSRLSRSLSKGPGQSLFIEPLLKRIGQSRSDVHRRQLCEALVSCIEGDGSCLATWSKVYAKHLVASAVLLNYIELNWSSLSSRVNGKAFTDLLKTFADTNEELLMKKRKEEGLKDSIEALRKLSKKMASKTKSSGCPCRTLFAVMLLALGFFVFIDIKQNGSWGNSTTLKALNRSGVCGYTHKALDRAKEGTIWVHERIEERFPGVTEATVEFTTPYIELGRDLGIVAGNLAASLKKGLAARIPILLEKIEYYAPGMLGQAQATGERVYVTVTEKLDRTRDYLLTEVFVGKMSPEEIQKLVSNTCSTGIEKLNEYYYWVYEKVTTAIK